MEALFLPVLLFVAAATLLCVGLLSVGSLLGPKGDSATKEMPYESGMNPIHDTHRRFDVRFHLVAICFLIFDVELLFLYPWAVASHNADAFPHRLLVFGEVMVFIGLLAAGLVYAWRKGVFQWR